MNRKLAVQRATVVLLLAGIAWAGKTALRGPNTNDDGGQMHQVCTTQFGGGEVDNYCGGHIEFVMGAGVVPSRAENFSGAQVRLGSPRLLQRPPDQPPAEDFWLVR